MSDRSNRAFRLAISVFFVLLAGIIHREPAQAAVTDDGRERLDGLLNEGIEFIKKQRGPHAKLDDGLGEIELIFFDVDHPYCPHCPEQKPTTQEQETEISSVIQVDAKKGKPRAQLQLAVRYLEGKGISRDVVQGLFWLQTASDNGEGSATFALAQMYDRGIEVPVDQQRAARLYEIAADDRVHSTVARRRLGEMNEFGVGIPKNYAKAMALYQMELARPAPPFSDLHLSQPAEFAIGRMYAQGKSVPQDYGKAAEWFLRATDWGTGYGGGVPEAECALAIMYWTGLGVKRDQERGNFFLHRPNAMSMRACQKLEADRPLH